MCPGGYPIQESQNWQSAFLPGAYQGTYINTQHQQLDRLIENIRNSTVSREQQRQQLDLLRQLNERHLEKRAADGQLEARIQSFELAYGMQRDAEDAFDVSREPQYIRDMYGPGVQARHILIARRLLEKGVRFIQIWHGEGQPWDNHDDLEVNHRRLARQCDQAIGALLKDLKQRGMLDDTLVIWGGEFGRTPTVELPTPGAASTAATTTTGATRPGSPAAASRAAWSTAPPTPSASRPLSRRSTSTTCRQRSCGYWASTTNGSRIAMPAAISG
jgi:hypothetical protein